jgi:putative transcriptional regulator
MPKAYSSAALAAVHEVALGLAEAGTMDKYRLPDFDAFCLTPVEPLSPAEIRALRLRENASQAVFALHLNVTTGLVSQMGTRRETAERGFVNIADAGGTEGVAGGGLRHSVREGSV